jgi:hypothetical protein
MDDFAENLARRVDTAPSRRLRSIWIMPPSTDATPAFPVRPHPQLYEINTWAWLEQLSVKLGRLVRLADVPDTEWDLIAGRGFDIVWLMGVWQRSEESRRIALADPANPPQYDRALPGWKPSDVISSPYAVAQYAPDPRIGTWDSLDIVREKLHARKMALFLDFVGNHTALDHPWTREHPEFYVQVSQQEFEKDPTLYHRVEKSGGAVFLALARDPYFPPWKDAAQLNHFQPAMRAAQLADLRAIAAHCDGVRCDMAMLHLNSIFAWIWGRFLHGASPPEKEFWAEAHAAVPNLILLAEAYWGTEPRLLDLGFSFAYDKELYDAVRDVKIEEIQARLGGGVALENRLARFLENHDEARRATVFGNERLQAAGTLMATLPGMRFYHQGELEGRRIHLPITLRMAADEPLDRESASFFEKILGISREEVFHAGEWGLLPVANEGDSTSRYLVVYEWRSAIAWKIIVLNFSPEPSQGRVHLGDRVSPAKNYVLYDQLNDVRYPRSGEELSNLGLFIRRDAFQAHVFDVTLVP